MPRNPAVFNDQVRYLKVGLRYYIRETHTMMTSRQGPLMGKVAPRASFATRLPPFLYFTLPKVLCLALGTYTYLINSLSRTGLFKEDLTSSISSQTARLKRCLKYTTIL